MKQAKSKKIKSIFGVITKKNLIFLLASMEAQNQLYTSYHFWVFNYKTSDNLNGWEAMSDNARPK